MIEKKKSVKQRLIDAEHLKERIMRLKSGSWVDIYTMMAYIDSEPTVKSDFNSVSQELRELN